MLQGKTVVLGVTGSIAAYKIASLASMLVKEHCDVHVVMTENATHFITPITFETLTGNKCLTETFDRNFQFHVAHVSLTQKADCMMIAPASANVIGKLANGIADDMLTTMAMASTCPILLAPAMNTHMYLNPILQNNLEILRTYHYQIIEPDTGFLACRDEGIGKMPSETVLFEHIIHTIAYEKDLTNRSVLITAGPTQEAIDPVRFISNHSTGKMGYALAKAASQRGARVTLITGPTSLNPPPFVQVIPVVSANDMYEAVTTAFPDHEILIKSAAVADYTPLEVSQNKIKKKEGDMSLALQRTKDILATLGREKQPNQTICGFSMETQNLVANSRDKLIRKNADMMIANNLKEEGAGFGVDTNRVTIITRDLEKELPLMSKEQVAHQILNEILELRK